MILASLQQTVLDLGHRGALALVRAGAVGGLTVVGAGLVTAAVLMGLAMLIGAIWACLILGLVFLGLAAGLTVPRKAPPAPPPSPPLEEIIFTLGFVAARALLRKRP